MQLLLVVLALILTVLSGVMGKDTPINDLFYYPALMCWIVLVYLALKKAE